MHWDTVDKPLVEFTSAVAKLRQQHPTFRRKRFFTGTTVRTGDGDAAQRHRLAAPRRPARWSRTTGTSGSQAIGMYLNGDGIAGKDARGRTITDDHFLLYFNADGPAEVTLPPEEFARAWDVVIDTGGAADEATTLEAGRDVPDRHPHRRGAPGARRARGRARPLGRRVRGRPGPDRGHRSGRRAAQRAAAHQGDA